jgi:hypothetical protein
MNPTNPWFRLFAGILAAAIALRLAVEILRPTLPFLIVAAALVGGVQIVRWWRGSGW